MNEEFVYAIAMAALASKSGEGGGEVPASLKNQVNANTAAIETLNGSGDGSVRKSVATAIGEIVAGAPDDLDTLKEIADYIAADKTGAAEVATTLSAIKQSAEESAANLGGHTVGTDVPSDAVFTDTVYDDTAIRNQINGKANTEDVPAAGTDEDFDDFLNNLFGD